MPDYSIHASPVGQAGGRRRGASVKTLKRMLKKAGLKVSGKKATLTRRAKKAHLKMRGGEDDGAPATVTSTMPMVPEKGADEEDENTGGRRRRGRKGSRRGGVMAGPSFPPPPPPKK